MDNLSVLMILKIIERQGKESSGLTRSHTITQITNSSGLELSSHCRQPFCGFLHSAILWFFDQSALYRKTLESLPRCTSLRSVHGGVGDLLVQVPVHVCVQSHRDPSPNTLGTSFITGATLESRPRSVQVDLPGVLVKVLSFRPSSTLHAQTITRMACM